MLTYEDLSDQDLELLDSVCEQFESEVHHQQVTAMDFWITKVPETVREVLLGELIAIKYENYSIDELLAGQRECHRQLPSFEKVITHVFDELVRSKTSPKVDFKNEQPDRIGRFEVRRTIGRGGTGVVYLAEDTRLRRTVAIKVLSNAIHASAKLKQRFIQEAELAAQLQFDNVVRVFEAGEYQGYPYIALEFVDGSHLGNYTKGQPQNQKTAAAWVRTLARAVAEAHRHGIVHRDLKPSNVLVKTRNDVSTGTNDKPKSNSDSLSTNVDRVADSIVLKIADFGLAKNIHVDSELTATGTIAGTPQFMSPEQAKGDVSEAGPSADVYSLGAILYFLLTGRPPFLEATAVETLLAVQTIEPVPPSTLVAKVARDIETICLRCLEKNPKQRFQSAGELADELERFIDGVPILSRPVSQLERFGRWCGRNRSLAAVGMVCLLSIILGVGGVTWQWRKSVANEKKAIENGKLASENAESATQAKEAQQRLTSRLYFDKALALAEENDVAEALHWFLAALRTSPGHQEDVHWQQVVRHSYANWLDEWHPVLNQHQLEGGVLSTNASPCGRVGLLGCLKGLVYRVDLENGDLLGQPIKTKVDKNGWSGVWATAFHPQGDWFVVGSANRDPDNDGPAGRLSAFDTKTGISLNRTLELDLPVEALCFSRDGSVLYVAVGKDHDPGGRVLVLDANSFQVREVSHQTGGTWHSLELTENNQLKVFYKRKHHKNVVESELLDPERLDRLEKLGTVNRPIKSLSTVYYESEETQRAGEVIGMLVANRLVYYDTTGMVSLHDASVSWKRMPPWFRKELKPINTDAISIDAVHLHPKSPGLIWGAPDGWFYTTDSSRKPNLERKEDIPGRCLSVAYSPDGKLYAVASDQIRIFDSETGEPVSDWMRHESEVAVLAFSPDSQSLAAGDFGSSVRLWDVKTGTQIGQSMKCADIVISLDFSPDGERLAIGTASDHSENPQAMIWGVPNCQPLSPPLKMPTYVRRVEFSKDGRRLLTVSNSNFRVWDGMDGTPIGPETRFSTSKSKAVFSQGGRFVISASGAGDIRAWDPITGELLEGKSYRARRTATCIDAESSDELFVVGFADGTVRVFDWQEFVPIGPAARLPEPIKATRLSTDGKSWLAVDSLGHFAEFQLRPAAVGSVNELMSRTEVITGIRLDSNLQRQIFSVEQWRQLEK